MVVRIHNVTKWEVIDPGSVLRLTGADGEPRKVRVELNCPEPTRVDLVGADGRVFFVAVVTGYEVVQFTTYDAECHLAFSTDGEVWFFTNDGDQIGVDRSMVTESFATVMQRRARNPELERMMFKMNQNIERRLAQQAAELEAIKRAREEEVVDVPEADVGGGASDGAAGNGEAEAGEPVEPAPEGAGGGGS